MMRVCIKLQMILALILTICKVIVFIEYGERATTTILHHISLHPTLFRVSRLTVYTQSIFCYTLLVSNTGLGPTSHSKNRGYNKLLGTSYAPIHSKTQMPGTDG